MKRKSIDEKRGNKLQVSEIREGKEMDKVHPFNVFEEIIATTGFCLMLQFTICNVEI